MRGNDARLRFSSGTRWALIGIAALAIVVELMIVAATGANTCAACVSTPSGKGWRP